MLAVGLGADAASTYINDNLKLGDSVRVACVNSPTSVTVSGDADSIEVVKAALQDQNIFVRKLRTGGIAYHSHHMNEVGKLYEYAIENALRKDSGSAAKPVGRASMMSTVTGEMVGGKSLTASYWRQNLQSRVLFASGLESLLQLPLAGSDNKKVDYLLEIGPHHALQGPIRQTAGAISPSIVYGHTLKQNNASADAVLRAVGNLFLTGYPVDMLRVNSHLQGGRSLDSGLCPISFHGKINTDLPTYNWNHTVKHPVLATRVDGDWKLDGHSKHDLLGSILPGCSKLEPVWRSLLRYNSFPWFKEHRVSTPRDLIFFRTQ